jgi:hypothetical protein
MHAILEFFYSWVNSEQYYKDKCRIATREMVKGMSLSDLIENCKNPCALQDGIAQVFLEEIVNRGLLSGPQRFQKNPLQK